MFTGAHCFMTFLGGNVGIDYLSTRFLKGIFFKQVKWDIFLVLYFKIQYPKGLCSLPHWKRAQPQCFIMPGCKSPHLLVKPILPINLLYVCHIVLNSQKYHHENRNRVKKSCPSSDSSWGPGNSSLANRWSLIFTSAIVVLDFLNSRSPTPS